MKLTNLGLQKTKIISFEHSKAQHKQAHALRSDKWLLDLFIVR